MTRPARSDLSGVSFCQHEPVLQNRLVLAERFEWRAEHRRTDGNPLVSGAYGRAGWWA